MVNAVSSAVDTVEAEVRELVRRRGLDPVEDRVAMRRLIDEVVLDDDERSLSSTLPALPDPRQAARAVHDAVAGFGPLQRYLDDPEVEEIWINARLTAGCAVLRERSTAVQEYGKVPVCRGPRQAPDAEDAERSAAELDAAQRDTGRCRTPTAVVRGCSTSTRWPPPPSAPGWSTCPGPSHVSTWSRRHTPRTPRVLAGRLAR